MNNALAEHYDKLAEYGNDPVLDPPRLKHIWITGTVPIF